MKKLLALLLTIALTLSLTLSLASCTEDEDDVINVGYFAGTTGLGMVKMINDGNQKYKFTKYSGPDTIKTAFITGEIDIAALPTNAAPAIYTTATHGEAQLLAINTLGVLYICTNGAEITSLNDLSGKTIYVPEKAPMLVLKYVLDTAGVQNYTLSEEYDLDMLPKMLANGTAPIALLPEPKVTVAQNQYKAAQAQSDSPKDDFKIALNMSDEWDKVSDKPLVQGCVIVNPAFASANPDLMASFLSDYEASINYMKDPQNLETAAQMTADIGILPNVAVAKSAIPRSNITFMVGEDMKAAAIGFFSAFNISDPGDAFYYMPAED